jgi:hypothetical protein
LDQGDYGIGFRYFKLAANEFSSWAVFVYAMM